MQYLKHAVLAVLVVLLAGCIEPIRPPDEKNPLATPLSIDLSLPTVEPVSASAPSPSSENPQWHWDAGFGGFVIDEVQNGMIDVHMDDTLIDSVYGPIIFAVQGGSPTKFHTDVPGEITFCVGKIEFNGNVVAEETNCTGNVVKVDAGEIVVKDTTGPTGGYRWSPQSGFGWKKSAPQTCPPLDGLCWEQQDSNWVWTGALNGEADIHQAAMSDVLEWIRAGGVVTVTMSVPSQVIDTCNIKVTHDGKVVEDRQDCAKINEPIMLEPGTIVLSESLGENGGWRLSPEPGHGWRKDEGK